VAYDIFGILKSGASLLLNSSKPKVARHHKKKEATHLSPLP